MQICMKATAEQLDNLKQRIAQANSERSLSRAEIAEISHVHASQVSRICRGEFKTISHNVVQVCTALGLEVEAVKVPATKADASWSKIKNSARSVWDNSPEGAEKIVRILETIGELRSTSAR